MTPQEASREVVKALIESSSDALATARRERMLSPATAINRAYYAAFYAASAVLIASGQHFVKHTGVRGALHRDLVKTGSLGVDLGREYDTLMDARHAADYTTTIRQTTEHADEMIASAERLVAALLQLVPQDFRGT